jgi:hypothetical protein
MGAAVPATEPPPPGAEVAATCRVRVAVRVRPLVAKERAEKARLCITVHAPPADETAPPQPGSLTIGKDRRFTFDHVYGQTASQHEIFTQCVTPLLQGCFQGTRPHRPRASPPTVHAGKCGLPKAKQRSEFQQSPTRVPCARHWTSREGGDFLRRMRTRQPGAWSPPMPHSLNVKRVRAMPHCAAPPASSQPPRAGLRVYTTQRGDRDRACGWR